MEQQTGTIPAMIAFEVPIQNVWGELISAFEGGSNYWLNDLLIERIVAEGIKYQYSHELPLIDGCGLRLTDPAGIYGWIKPFMLNIDAIDRGIMLSAKRTYHHCGSEVNILMDCLLETKNPDACTGDIFLQLCVFGDVIMS